MDAVAGGRIWRMVAAVAAVAAACSARQTYHVVRAGDTLSRIGQAYGVPHHEIARANRLRDPSHIEVGQRLIIPKAKAAPVVATLLPPLRDAGEQRPGDAPKMTWPVPEGTVTSGFGPRGSRFHDGIDISAPAGVPVRAVASGEVAYSASLPGYGNVIIVRHERGYATVYAHNERHHVEEGQRVRQGQLIATVGCSGRASGTNLHFEVRKDNHARNPLLFLPSGERADHYAGGK